MDFILHVWTLQWLCGAGQHWKCLLFLLLDYHINIESMPRWIPGSNRLSNIGLGLVRLIRARLTAPQPWVTQIQGLDVFVFNHPWVITRTFNAFSPSSVHPPDNLQGQYLIQLPIHKLKHAQMHFRIVDIETQWSCSRDYYDLQKRDLWMWLMQHVLEPPRLFTVFIVLCDPLLRVQLITQTFCLLTMPCLLSFILPPLLPFSQERPCPSPAAS